MSGRVQTRLSSNINFCSSLEADMGKFSHKFHGVVNRDASNKFINSMRAVNEQIITGDEVRKEWVQRIKATADFLRLCVLAGSLSKVLDVAITRKLELEHTRRVEDVLTAIRKVSGTVVDLAALQRQGTGSNKDRVRQGQWRGSPEKLAKTSR